MNEQKRIFLLILIMTLVALVVGGISIAMLYQAAFAEETTRLTEAAQSQARLIEAVARFNVVHQQQWHPGVGVPTEYTLNQIRDAHQNYTGFGKTGEFVLAQRDGDMIVFLLSHRHDDQALPQPIPFSSKLAEPMRRSLSSQSGTVVGLDYRGETVLAAYEPVPELNWGIVAKIDLVEIQAPFVRAGIIAGLAAIAVIILGALLFLRVTNPLLKQLEESEQRFRTTFEQAAVGIAHTTPDGHLAMLNQRFCDIVGYTRNELLGRTFQEITHPDDLAQNLEYKEQLMAGAIQSYAMEKRYLRKDGSPVWVELTVSLVRELSGEPKYLLGVVEDISRRKQAEEKLREHSEHLEYMVKERTQALEEAQAQLVRREKLAIIGQLGGSVAHELRHPLGVLANAVYFLKLTLTEANETVKEYLDIMSAEIRKSEKIISDLLNFSRTQSPEKREIAVLELVAQLLAKYPPPEQIEVSNQIAAGLPPVLVDPQQIEQVITNLAINAYQAMPEGGKLTIAATEISPEPPASGKVSIAFTDTGCGIPPDQMDKLFEPLFTTKAKGIGLGLVVSKNLTEANGGTIVVESNVGKGTTFTICLPIDGGGVHE